MATEKDDRYKLLAIAMQSLYDDLKLQFQRLGFFLTGTALLFTAFAIIVTSSQFNSTNNSYLMYIAYILNAVGLLLSLYFALVNYTITKIISSSYFNVLKIESAIRNDGGNFSFPLEHSITTANSLAKIGEIRLALEMMKDCWDFLVAAIQYANKNLFPHTWQIPLGFAYVWLSVLLSVLLPYWLIPTIIAGLIFLLFVSCRIYGVCKRYRKSKHKKRKSTQRNMST